MSDPEGDFYSFDEALDELRLKEEELKRLVSEGEIRAFRKGDTMKLRKSDVESLRAELSGGEVVDLGDVTEELVFEDDSDFGDDAGMTTQEISDVDTLIDDAFAIVNGYSAELFGVTNSRTMASADDYLNVLNMVREGVERLRKEAEGELQSVLR